jgi:hypothetical protein
LGKPIAEVQKVSLQGSLDTFALPDVLSLLSSTGKSGELLVTGGRSQGHVWLRDGKVVGALAGRASAPVDVLFELLRVVEGEFRFSGDLPDAEVGEPEDVAPILAEAQRRLEEWRGIEAVVPSLEADVRLVPEAPTDQVTVRADQWRLLVAIASELRVQGVIDRTGMGEFDTCRTIKELVEAGLAEVDMLSSGTSSRVSGQTVSDAVKPAAAPGRETAPDAEATEGDGPSDDDLVELPKRKPRATAAKPKATEPKHDQTSLSSKISAAAVAAAEELPEAEAKVLVEQLAALGDDEEAAKELARRVVAGEDLGDGDDEPINRGLLLKFLSSVRS